MKRFLNWLFGRKLKVKSYRYESFSIDSFRTDESEGLPKDQLNKAFGMIIPKEPIKINEMVEDPRGAPIYAPCPAKGGLCACTGACRRIVEYTKDPVKLAAHRQDIANYNSFQKTSMQNFRQTIGEGDTKIWEAKPLNPL